MRTTSTTKAAIAAAATLALVAGACGSSDGDSTPAGTDATPGATDPAGTDAPGGTDAPSTDGPISIGIVAPSAANDLAFTQSIVDSVGRLGGDVDVQITDGTFVVEDAAAAIRGYAESGVDLVIAHGSQYGAPLQEIAADFPDTTFAWGTAADTFGLDNVFAYTVRADQGGYVNGVIAAQLTESNNIGVVGPIEVGDAALYVDGFKAGVEATNADAAVNVTYIESFSDVALASEAATAFVQGGADVLTGTAQMVVGATGVAVEAGIPWFGTQSDQTSLGEDIVVASQEYHWEVVLNEIIASMSSGAAGGESFTLTFENGGLVMAFNDNYALPDDVRASADAAIAGLTDGSVTTGIE